MSSIFSNSFFFKKEKPGKKKPHYLMSSIFSNSFFFKKEKPGKKKPHYLMSSIFSKISSAFCPIFLAPSVPVFCNCETSTKTKATRAARTIIISTETWAREDFSNNRINRKEKRTIEKNKKIRQKTNELFLFGFQQNPFMNRREITEIAGSWLVISAAFGWVIQDRVAGATISQTFFPALLTALIAVGTGFIFHELAHKYVSIHYGVHAEFFAWPFGLLIALALAFTVGIVFAAPGAVYIFARDLPKRTNGIISVAGPLTNIGLGIVFVIAALLLATVQSQFLSTIAFQAGFINFFLAGFNLLPFGPLDGKKVFNWNKAVWAACFIPMLLIYVFIGFGF
jgi:Zn-dependent protease